MSTFNQTLINVAVAAEKLSKGEVPFGEAVKSKNRRTLILANGSMTEILTNFIIQPEIIVSEELQGTPMINKIIDYQIDTFVSFYIAVFKSIVQFYGFSPETTLRLLSSSTQVKAPSYINHALLSDMYQTETSDDVQGFKQLSLDTEPELLGDKSVPVFLRKFQLSFKLDKGNEIRFDMLARAIIRYVPSKDIVNAVDAGNPIDTSFTSQKDKWLSGEISFMDFALGLNILRDLKKKKIHDSTGLIKQIERRSRDSIEKIMTEGVPGLGKYHSMVIIDQETRKKITKMIKYKITSDAGKELVTKALRAMSIAIVDDDAETIMLVFQAFDGHTVLDFDQIKDPKKSNSDEIIKLLLTKGY